MVRATHTERPSIRSAVARFAAVFLCSLAFSAPVRATAEVFTDGEVGAFARVVLVPHGSGDAAQQHQDAIEAREFLRKVQDKILTPCFLNMLDTCRRTSAELVAKLKTAGLTPALWAVSIRNNMYFYLMAPSLRLASAILKAPGGGCDQWRRLAAEARTSLDVLLTDAAAEVAQRSQLPESNELRALQVFNGCRSAGPGD